MDRTSSISLSQNAIQALEHDTAMVTLPNDVLPNIYSRLPASDFFALARVSKQVQHSIQALLPEAIGQELRALSLHNSGDFVERLAVLLRLGGHHISNEDWTNFLQAVKSSDIDPRLVVVLLLSLARQDAALRKHPDTIAISLSPIYAYRNVDPYRNDRSKFATIICVAGMKQLMRVERLGSGNNTKPIQLSNRPGWKRLVDLFKLLTPVDQASLLLQVKPREADGANITLSFEELVGMHLVDLVASQGFIYLDRLLWKEPGGKRNAYFDILANAYTMARSPEHVTYFQEMDGGTLSVTLGLESWKIHSREHNQFVFRVLAYETRTNLSQNSRTFSNAIRSEVQPDFLTEAELNDFTEKLNVRVDQGMLLEDAVSMWIDENRNASSCVIS
jgi:hypothetical protein